jgi:AcrR family transcriptional regulator
LHLTIKIVNMGSMPSATKESADRAPTRTYGGVSAVERVAARRARLLDAALELYGTQGYLATGVKDVCRHAGLTDRYFYESFANSSELFSAVFDRTTGELLTLVAQRVGAAAGDPRAQARAAIETFVRTLADDPRKARLLFVETASAGPTIERHVRATVRQFAALVAATARPHVPVDTPDVVVQMGAFSLVGAIAGVIVEWQDGGLDASVEEVIAYFVDAFTAAGAAAGVATALRRPR